MDNQVSEPFWTDITEARTLDGLVPRGVNVSNFLWARTLKYKASPELPSSLTGKLNGNLYLSTYAREWFLSGPFVYLQPHDVDV